MIPKSFNDELIKIAALPGFLAALGGFLSKNVPAMASSLRGSAMAAGMADVTKMRVAGGAIGAIGGGYAGSKTGDETTKGRNTLLGAIAGTVGGSMGGKALATKLPTLGAPTVKDLSGLGEYMQRGKATGKGAVEYMAKNWTPKYAPFSNPGTAPMAKTLSGAGKEVPAVSVQTRKPGMVTGAIGEFAKSLSTIATPGKGIPAVLGEQFNKAKLFNKRIDGINYQFQRSGLGKVLNPALSTGVGFGAMEALTAKDEKGNPAGLGKRLLRGGSTALAWGAAPKLMTGKLLAYDIPKSLTGMKKQKEIPTQQY